MIFAYGCNERQYKYLVVDIYSLLKNNPKTRKIYLLLETERIDDVPYLRKLTDDYKNVEFVLIDFNKYKRNYVTNDNPNVDTPYTDFAFCKIVLADFVKEDKVIYLDTDTVVLGDLYRLWFWDIGDTYIAGCRDQVTTSVYFRDLGVDGKYINTGVMLLNLKKIREDGIIKDIFKILNNRELKFPDQDAINIVCQHNMTYIPSYFNQAYCVTNPIGVFERVKIYHMAGPKDNWLENNVFCEEWYAAEEEFFFKYIHKE
mgnify:CR=1 FL=1